MNDARYTYYRLESTHSGRPIGVVRKYDAADDIRFEKWVDGEWVMANNYASIVLLGDPPADEISEAEARRIIADLKRRRR